MKHIIRILSLLVMASAISACSSTKGTSSLRKSSTKNTTVQRTPRVKSSTTEIESSVTVANGSNKPANEVGMQNAVAKKVVVREESVKVVSSELKTPVNGKYHVIIGSFKVLDNAKAASNNAIKQGFLPSIMENDEGMYRVAIFSGEESSARAKVAEIRQHFDEYVGVWLLLEK